MRRADRDKPRQLVALVDVPKHRSWVTVRYLRRLVYERRIPYHKLDPGRSGRVLIDLEDLDRFVEESRVETT
jgi:excisionase family DNA binding protein